MYGTLLFVKNDYFYVYLVVLEGIGMNFLYIQLFWERERERPSVFLHLSALLLIVEIRLPGTEISYLVQYCFTSQLHISHEPIQRQPQLIQGMDMHAILSWADKYIIL